MRPSRVPWALLLLALLLAYPIPALGMDRSLGSDLTFLFIYGILALGLNVVVGFTGLLHLGIAGFFGAGAYLAGIVTVQGFPFQLGFLWSLVIATGGAALLGVLLGAPTLRLKGDYLALVTLGFGEVMRFTLRNLESITGGSRALNPVPPPPAWLAEPFRWLGLGADWNQDYALFYYLCLGLLVLVFVLLRNLEKSRLGRAWVTIREDELAATCMGISATHVKLSAFALGAGLAGLAGCLYATKLTSTAGPEAYDFSRSVIVLCCVIVGGLGSLRGCLLGVALLIGFDNILAPIFDNFIQNSGIRESAVEFLRDHEREDNIQLVLRLLTFSNWRLLIFGLALILVMRFRPEGLLPSTRMKEELHSDQSTSSILRMGGS